MTREGEIPKNPRVSGGARLDPRRKCIAPLWTRGYSMAGGLCTLGKGFTLGSPLVPIPGSIRCPAPSPQPPRPHWQNPFVLLSPSRVTQAPQHKLPKSLGWRWDLGLGVFLGAIFLTATNSQLPGRLKGPPPSSSTPLGPNASLGHDVTTIL